MLYSADALDGFNGNFRVPFLPVNSLYTPWVQQENFRVTKNIPLPKESMQLSLMFEAFNIANNWSPTALTTQAYTETKITGAAAGSPVHADLHSDGLRCRNRPMADSRTARRLAASRSPLALRSSSIQLKRGDSRLSAPKFPIPRSSSDTGSHRDRRYGVVRVACISLMPTPVSADSNRWFRPKPRRSGRL